MDSKSEDIEQFKKFYTHWKQNKGLHNKIKPIIPISVKSNYILKISQQQTFQIVSKENLSQIIQSVNARQKLIELENQLKNFLLLKGSQSLCDKSMQLKLWNIMLNVDKQKMRYKNKFDYDQLKQVQDKNCKIYTQIQKDLKRTDIENNFKGMQKEQVFESLLTILYVYSKINNKVSYCQGMNFIATAIYFNLQVGVEQDMEQEAFWIFLTLMEQYRIKEYYLKLEKVCELSETLELYLKESDNQLLDYITYDQFNIFVYFHNFLYNNLVEFQILQQHVIQKVNIRILPKLLLTYLKRTRDQIMEVQIREFLMNKIRYDLFQQEFQQVENFQSLLEDLNLIVDYNDFRFNQLKYNIMQPDTPDEPIKMDKTLVQEIPIKIKQDDNKEHKRKTNKQLRQFIISKSIFIFYFYIFWFVLFFYPISITKWAQLQ